MTVPGQTSGNEPNNGKSGRHWRRFAAGMLVAGGIALPVVMFGGWEAGAIVFGGVLTVAPRGRHDGAQ
ncbi:hypothetical protein [Nocardia sp. XZ_19_385]|uniref:hypothetical protein n=1 Tax=Nocardia sp. XZ_19_385 TaxID=2769488 RepID=UPI0018909D47|nr:hypothetical protein [Nocardia sp. XZ_19_385]